MIKIRKKWTQMELFNFLTKPKIPLKDIALIVLDFDGIFTDNKVMVSEEGKEFVNCTRADGLGIQLLNSKHVPMLILSTETNPVVASRARKLNLPVIQGEENKKQTLIKYCEENKINLQNVMYAGNDLNDYEVMKCIGFPVAPKDAHPEIKRIAKYIISKKGGEGVVRELAENLIQY